MGLYVEIEKSSSHRGSYPVDLLWVAIFQIKKTSAKLMKNIGNRAENQTFIAGMVFILVQYYARIRVPAIVF